MPMKTKMAILLDMDGVVVDNIQYHREAWKQFCKKYAFAFSDELFANFINGRVSKDIMEYFFGQALTQAEIDRYTEEKESIYRALYRPYLQPTKGLMAFLQALQQQGVRFGLGSSAPDENVNFILDGLGIRPYLDAIVNASMVSKGKPDPEIYLKAADQLEVNPSNCIVIEDALSGIKAGKNAGMKVIGMATTHGREALKQADLVVPDFTPLNFSTLQSLLN